MSQVIKWGFGYFNEEKKEWQTYSDPIAEGSRDILKETDRGQCAIYHLVELMCTSQIDKDTQIEVVKELAEIGGSNPVAMSGLVELIGTSEDDNTWRSAINSLGKIDKDNSVAISALVDLIGTFQDKNTQRRAAVSLGKICKDNVVAIATLVDLIRNSNDNIARWQAADILGEIIKGKHFVLALSGLKDCLNSEVYENDFNRYKDRYPIIWACAQNMTYPEFYQAWHTQPTNSPTPDRNHRQNTDIPTLLKQLQSTDKTFKRDRPRALYPTISNNLPRRYRHPRHSQRPRIQAINSPTQKSAAKTAHRLNFALLSLRRCAFVFHPQTRRHSHGNSYRLDYRYTAGIAANRFCGGWR
ncbi:MAG: HEAT repeat domain-containing protein [Oscillatoriales cyanobacterium]|nr:MAG: HEAT repeat domain-containing protein [Oscillatoriales cyanobacterium]